MNTSPVITIFAGANGAGKTTFALEYIKSAEPQGMAFLNADEIARELSPENPENQNTQAGRILLSRLSEYIQDRQSFVLETTLSGRLYLNYLDKARKQGFKIVLHYYYTEDPIINVERIKNRVLEGGHNVEDEDVIRRHARSLKNLVQLYWDKADIIYIFRTDAGFNDLIQIKFVDEVVTIKDDDLINKMIELKNDE